MRPCYFPSQSLVERAPIKANIIKGVNFMLIRENCGGAYFGKKIEEEDYGCDPWEYTRDEIERVARVAGTLAMQTDPPTPVTSVDKANVLASSRVRISKGQVATPAGGQLGDAVHYAANEVEWHHPDGQHLRRHPQR
jgi:isocitrate/isopropylmalate dehydrogenase